MELCLPSSCQPKEDYRDELFRRLGTCISWNKTVLPGFLYTIQCTNLQHTSWQVYTISASMRYDHTTNQTHPSPLDHPSPQKYPQGGSLDVGSSDGGSWRLIRPQTFLKSPDGLTSTTRALGAPVFFPWRAFAFSALAGETATRLKSAMHWTLTDCFSCWSCCLDWGWCQLHNLDHIFVMQNMVFATHLSQGDVKQWNCSSHNCYHCSMWFVFLTRHLELQPSIPSSWLKWQPTSTYHLSVNPGLVWDYDKEHEFCGLCPSHSKTKWSTIPVDPCWLILDQPDCNTLQQPGLGRLLHAAAPHKGVLEVFQQGFWVNMRYFESGGTGRNNSHAQIDDNWIQDSV